MTAVWSSATVLTIDRPAFGNSLDPPLGHQLVDALHEAAADPAVRAIVLTGAGERTFCAGMDLVAFSAGLDMAPVVSAFDRLATFPKPVIAAVNGQALGGGFEIVMRCDLVVAADHARFGLPEVKRGVVAGGGGTRLPNRIPLVVALEIGLTGEPVSAARALELGLVNRVVPGAEVMSTALGFAAMIEANAPLAVAATKRLMRDELGPDDPARMRQVAGEVSTSQDAREGARAFTEKCSPVWRGR